MVDTGVIHGRFQVLHNDHLKYLLAGKERCHHLVVGITNPDPNLTLPEASDAERSSPLSNPLTYYERLILIREALREARIDLESFSIVPFPINHPELYGHYVPLDATFYLTIYDAWGRRKLERFRDMGLKTEVLWERSYAEKGLSGTVIRLLMAGGEPWEHTVPPSSRRWLQKWKVPERIRMLKGMA